VFEGGIVLKGVSGVSEFLAGLLLVFVSPAAMRTFLAFVTQREIAEDPGDTLANFILHTADHFNAGNHLFAIGYLWIHAAIKLTAVIGILRNQLWAYPFSVGMLLLTVFDVLVLALIWREYGKVRLKPAGGAPAA